MNRIIINADDCGYSKDVNRHIEYAINKRRITSTSVMANMDDFDGAVHLYKEYKDTTSFGFHMNLTQGTPLLYSQELLDLGFFKEDNGLIVFDGNPFRRKLLSKRIREAIYKEVLTQAEKIMDSGVKISHIDSHHFMHQSVFMIPLLPKLCNDIGVFKIRNYRNYMPFSLNKIIRTAWSKVIKIENYKISFPKYFVDFQTFYNNNSSGIKYHKDNDTIELMCHPGGIYKEEEDLLLEIDVEKKFNCQLINFNEL